MYALSSPQLYAITDADLLPGDKLYDAVAQAINGGCKWIQYRNKNNADVQGVAQASRLKQICDNAGAILVINDSVELAIKIGATAVHLGQGDGDVREARHLLGANAIIGVTCHDSLALAEKAIDEGASYIAFGRFYISNTKPNARAADIALIRQAREKFPQTPIAVIGGINTDNLAPLVAQGADLIAVCHSLFSADDIQHQSQLFFHSLNLAAKHRV